MSEGAGADQTVEEIGERAEWRGVVTPLLHPTDPGRLGAWLGAG